MKRPPLKRGKPLKARTEMKRGTKALKGSKLKPMSVKRQSERSRRGAVVANAVIRSGGRCVAALRGAPEPCRGDLVGHELCKRTQLPGGHLIPENVVAVCEGHNSWIEDEPELARQLGLNIPRWQWDQDHGSA